MANGNKPNLVERMENLIAALDEIREQITTLPDWQTSDLHNVDNADGIATEILTMIDGR